MAIEIINPAAQQEELDIIHMHFQKILSLSLSGYRSTESVTDRVIMQFHKSLCGFLRPHRYAAFHRNTDGIYLNECKLPDSFVMRRLFDTVRCSGLCFQPGLDLQELRDCVAEMEECLMSGSASQPLGLQRNFLRHYYWLPPGHSLLS